MGAGGLVPADERTAVDRSSRRTPPGWWASPERRAPNCDPPPRLRLRRAATVLAHPVPAALVTAAVMHLLWRWLVANSGGDLAAQDAWAEFARLHPGSAYDLAWYGGVHPVSYSAISPYVMAILGVRTTMMLAGTLSAGLLALVLVRSHALRRPLWPALYGALALTGNAVSGRVTFGLGAMFGLAAIAVIFVWPERWRFDRLRHKLPRAALAGVLSAVATASSPVAGLFLGIVAAALWLGQRRSAAYAIGLPPVAVVVLSAWLFPFSGQQPMASASTVLPVACGVCGLVLAPNSWRAVRIGSALYVAAVLVVWVVPSPIGSNVTRLGLVFGGVLLVAIAAQAPPLRRPVRWSEALGVARTWTAVAVAIAISSIWQISIAVSDAISSRPAEAWTFELGPLVHQLEARNADQARVEVVPARSHREASALAPYVNLARGWNRQADAERNPIFYRDGLLTPASYRAWLDRWAVKYVVLPTGQPDAAAVAESQLVAGGLDYLHEVWSDADWSLYEVMSPTPLADPPAVVTRFDATEVVLTLSSAGTVLVRIPDSPWLSLVDEHGKPLEPPESVSPGIAPVNVHGCLSGQEQPTAPDQAADEWTLLHAPKPGVYRIAAPYTLPRGTACPENMVN
jgi:hypothetical protein